MPTTPVTGTFFQTKQPVSLASTDVTGNLPVKLLVTGTSAFTNVASSASTGTLLASNANRLGAIIYNDSTANLFVKFGATASSTSFTFKMAAGDTLFIDNGYLYTGIIDGIWDAANGYARVTENT